MSTAADDGPSKSDVPPVQFEWDGIKYYLHSVECVALGSMVKLPDGRYLKVTVWKEIYPPVPGAIKEVHMAGGSQPAASLAWPVPAVTPPDPPSET
jgi:hypothetical protein